MNGEHRNLLPFYNEDGVKIAPCLKCSCTKYDCDEHISNLNNPNDFDEDLYVCDSFHLDVDLWDDYEDSDFDEHCTTCDNLRTQLSITQENLRQAEEREDMLLKSIQFIFDVLKRLTVCDGEMITREIMNGLSKFDAITAQIVHDFCEEE